MTARSKESGAIDLVIAGAGPAGMAAAITARSRGARVLVLDEQAGPGGQIYRGIETTPLVKRHILGKDYWQGAKIAEAFRSCGADMRFGATIWTITEHNQVAYSVAGRAAIARAKQIILATGAMERPMPIPGWTTPGVLSAGAGQILLKTGGLVPDGKAVLAGTGPLLWLLAAQYLRAGYRPAAVLDTTSRHNLIPALPYLPAFAASRYAREGLALLREVRRSVPVISDVESLSIAEVNERVANVKFASRDGRKGQVDASVVLLHQGVIPNVALAQSIGCRMEWDADVACLKPAIDRWNESSRLGIRITGDCAGIAGARAAEHQGHIAALGALRDLGIINSSDAERLSQSHRAHLRDTLRGRRFLDHWFLPRAQHRRAHGDTVICRCEEVTADAVLEGAALGFDGPNRVKTLLRCGMGPCQGRMCGPSVAETLAAARHLQARDIGTFRQRLPVKPTTLAEIASLPSGEAERYSVHGLDLPKTTPECHDEKV